jgi:hypothetical protein
MGKGKWCVRGSCAELPKESNQESNDALCHLELSLAATIAQKIQVPGDFKVAVKLRRGAEGHAETTDELKRRAEGVSFNHIRGYGYRRSTDLVGEAEVTTEGFSEREPVGGTRQRIRALPGLKGRELLHGGNLVVRLHSRDIVFVQSTAKRRTSGIPFPFPHSPFPGV